MANDEAALLLIDIQYDFLPPDGSLAVPDGRAILPVVQKLLADSRKYDLIVATRDYHPLGHISFASTHGLPPFTVIEVPKWKSPGETICQTLWPDHCVQKTHGSEIESSVQQTLDKIPGVKYILKGTNVAVDAYSGFADNAYSQFTHLSEIFFSRGIKTVVVAGLATDYCVKFSSIDARKFGFRTIVVEDAIRAVDPKNVESVLEELRSWGCEIVNSNNIPK